VSIADSNQYWSMSAGHGRTGALVLAGSSGRQDKSRADMLASHGVTALALRWFGGEGQPAVPREIPLETFSEAIDLLTRHCERVVVIGLSYGAEAALLTACFDDRIDAVVAMAPSDVAWEGDRSDAGDPQRSKWKRHCSPVPFVPIDRAWEPSSTTPAFVGLYEKSRSEADPKVVDAATIPVEKIRGNLVLVAGGDDQVWPSVKAARALVARRSRFGLDTHVIEDATAGHAVVLPGEHPGTSERPYQVGGDDDGPHRLGALAWPAIRQVLHIVSV
jgi:pimeloyl-ACP methyl ester carboxylesterase